MEILESNLNEREMREIVSIVDSAPLLIDQIEHINFFWAQFKANKKNCITDQPFDTPIQLRASGRPKWRRFKSDDQNKYGMNDIEIKKNVEKVIKEEK